MFWNASEAWLAGRGGVVNHMDAFRVLIMARPHLVLSGNCSPRGHVPRNDRKHPTEKDNTETRPSWLMRKQVDAEKSINAGCIRCIFGASSPLKRAKSIDLRNHSRHFANAILRTPFCYLSIGIFLAEDFGVSSMRRYFTDTNGEVFRLLITIRNVDNLPRKVLIGG